MGEVREREPEWDSEQRELMLGLLAWRANLDPNGLPLDEVTSLAADPNNYEGGFRYVTEGPFTNWAEKARLDSQEAWRKAAGDNANMHGLYWTVRRADG